MPISFKSFLLKQKTHVLVGCLFLLVFFLYLHNLTRDVYSGDIGDLVTASFVHGVAHPSGYPLFVFLGFLFSHLPLPIPVVTRVGLISAIVSTVSLVLFYDFARRVTKNAYLALLSTAILAFSYLFWLDAEIPEVFGLNNFFALVIMYTSVLFYQTKQLKYLYLLALFCGLSLTHHQTIVLLFPGVLLLLLKHSKFIFSQRKRAVTAVGLFVLGLAPLLYIPIAASTNPVINWDNATTLGNFLHLFLRKDYSYTPSVVNHVPWQINLLVLRDYGNSLVSVLSYQIIALIVIGAISLWRQDKRLLITFLVMYILAGPFFVFYGATPVTSTPGFGIMERFYSLSIIVLLFLVPYGFSLLHMLIQKKLPSPALSLLLLSYFLIVPVFMLRYNMPRTDLSQTHIGNSLGENIFRSLPAHSVVFVTGDSTTFSIWYLHYVLGERPDIDIINPPGVGNNLYLDEQINNYHKTHPKLGLSQVFNATIETIRQHRPLYATFQLTQKPKDLVLLPQGMVYKIIPQDQIPNEQTFLSQFETTWKKVQPARRDTLTPADQNLIAAEMPMLYSNGLISAGDFLSNMYHDPARSESYYRRALWIDDQNPTAYSGLGLSLYKAYKDCPDATNDMQTAIAIYPIWPQYYGQLYLLSNLCHSSKQQLSAVANDYQKNFHEPIENNDLVKAAHAQKLID